MCHQAVRVGYSGFKCGRDFITGHESLRGNFDAITIYDLECADRQLASGHGLLQDGTYLLANSVSHCSRLVHKCILTNLTRSISLIVTDFAQRILPIWVSLNTQIHTI